ncbi:MAG: hypothetical protein GF408_02290 [Candidatus Omnitrophica bacterium]|nr:hypothetical protein [Candidatus Omnitrophota bacterium]
MKNGKYALTIACLLAVYLLGGCAEMDMPSGNTMLKSPVGSGNIKKGMTKSQVLNEYGEPDLKRVVTSKGWAGEREEWFYRARTSLPVGMGYLSENAYLYFDEDILTNISHEPMGSSIEKRTSEEDFIK